MGVPFFLIYLKHVYKIKKNKSVSISVQIIEERKGKYKVVASVGVAKTEKEEKELVKIAKARKEILEIQLKIPFLTKRDNSIEDFLVQQSDPIVINIGPELILGKLFDSIGLNKIDAPIFRHIVLARLTYPVSKLRTTEYLLQHKNFKIDVDNIYRFLDKFHKEHKAEVEKIVYEYSKRILGEIRIVFYDMTTLYFEPENEDDLRKIGFSKDGKFQCPQIMLGLLVGGNGYPIGYDIFEGNTVEGHTIIPAIEKIQKKYNLPKPMIIADNRLLSKENIKKLEEGKYEFILGARIKNEFNKLSENQKNLLEL